LDDKLATFNCLTGHPFEIAVVEENNNLPHKLFIIGLIIGDGSLGFVFDEPKARAPKFYIKILFNFASQKAIDSNIHLLTLVAKYYLSYKKTVSGYTEENVSFLLLYLLLKFIMISVT